MKKLIAISLILYSVFLASCVKYEDPVVPLISTLDTTPSFSFDLNGVPKSSSSAYGIITNTSQLQITGIVDGLNAEKISFVVPFTGTTGMYKFISNTTDHNFNYDRSDSLLKSCSVKSIYGDTSSTPFAKFEYTNVKFVSSDKFRTVYKIDGSFEYSIINKCGFYIDTLKISNGVFKNFKIVTQ